jgi:hypothetical protein
MRSRVAKEFLQAHVHRIVDQHLFPSIGTDGDEIRGLTVVDPNAVEATEAFGLVFHC